MTLRPIDFPDDSWHDYVNDGEPEIIGSCDNCECDVYEGDDYYMDGALLCSSCDYLIEYAQRRRAK